MTIQEVLTQLLYPYVAPSVSAFLTYSPSGTLFEKGTVVEITALNGSFIQRSEEIVNIKFLDGTEILYERADELESNTVYTYTFGEPIRITNDMNNTRFRVSVIDGVNEIFANTIAFSFCYPYYFDVIENDTVLSSNLIKNMNKKIETKGNKTYTYTTNNQRMVIAYPKSYGNLSKIIDQNNFDVTPTFTQSEINVVGKDGTSQTYYVYVNNASSVENFRMTFQY